jgi:hypothetical protein
MSDQKDHDESGQRERREQLEQLKQARERRAGLRAAMGDVEKSLASPASGRIHAWAKFLRDDLEKLSVALDLHIAATEGAGGLLDDIVTTAPRLANAVDQAKRDHQQLRYRLDTALHSLPTDSDTEARAARNNVVEVLAGLARHRHLGADLVYEAYNVDIEAAD